MAVKTIEFYGALFDGAGIGKEITRATQKTQKQAEAILKGNTPVRTGRLQAGWSIKPYQFGFVYTNPTPYGVYVEMGTRHFAARAMLKRSLPEIEAAFASNIGYEVGKRLGTKIIGGVGASDTNYENLTGGVKKTAGGFTGKYNKTYLKK